MELLPLEALLNNRHIQEHSNSSHSPVARNQEDT